jgi:ABC-2 type transport system permease protein
VQREVWEYRSIYLAPVAATVIFLFAHVISTLGLPHKVRTALALAPEQQMQSLQQPFNTVSLLLMGVTTFVALFYSIDSLYGERRDRSILFWKSMPVSDLTAVLSKASIPIVVLPLLTIGLTIAVHLLMILLDSVILGATAVSVSAYWSNVSLPQIWLMMLYHMIAMHGLWFAPVYGWLLMVSSWARRTPILWAVLPPFAIWAVEKIAFNTSYFGAFLKNWLDAPGSEAYPGSSVAMHAYTHIHLGQFLVSPGLWIGLVLTVAFLFTAARIRRYRSAA